MNHFKKKRSLDLAQNIYTGVNPLQPRYSCSFFMWVCNCCTWNTRHSSMLSVVEPSWCYNQKQSANDGQLLTELHLIRAVCCRNVSSYLLVKNVNISCFFPDVYKCGRQGDENSDVQGHQTHPVCVTEHTAPVSPHATRRESLASRPRAEIGLYFEALQPEFNTNNSVISCTEVNKQKRTNNEWLKNIWCYCYGYVFLLITDPPVAVHLRNYLKRWRENLK